MSDRYHLFGVRHHGPGCARSLKAALDALAPDLVLVEGPPDGDAAIESIGDEHLVPPVALLVYPVAHPGRGVFYPFAVFSPEWQALSWARSHGVPARFMDLPQSIRFALREARREPVEADAAEEPDEEDAARSRWSSRDPIGVLAAAAGYEDSELWWDHQVEQRQDPSGLFTAVHEAMTALRAEAGPPPPREALREAFMRRTLRQGLKEGAQRIAVICGAWHTPALAELPSAKSDDALLKGLPKTKVEATWIPWTHSRLSARSGYGAGVQSPGWYAHLWKSPDRAAIRWAASAARLLREEDLDASAANVIETVRLAEVLAAIRDRPQPALPELREAALAVLCGGSEAALKLIHDRLEIGEALGEVPEDAPAVPLQRDLTSQQKSLRMKVSPEPKDIDLDLRKENDREKSRLLHRLLLLGVDWGAPHEAAGQGTFHEPWTLQWDPELALKIVEASVHGQTVEAAATGSARAQADKATELAALTGLLDRAILAELPEAVDHALGLVQERAALHADVAHLMTALLPLARAARYGDVRGAAPKQLTSVIDGIFERILIGLPAAVASLDDAAAGALLEAVDALGESLRLLDRADLRQAWLSAIAALCERDSVHGLVRGRFTRLLLDASAIAEDELHRLARLSLSKASPPPQAAAWIEGLVRGGALSLLQRLGLWRALDAWLEELPEEAFIETLPLVRRAFATFQPPERRAMAEKIRRFTSTNPAAAAPELAGVDPERAARVLPVLAHLIGDGHG